MKLKKEDIQLIIKQTGCSTKKVKNMLREHDNDIDEVIFLLSSQQYEEKNKEHTFNWIYKSNHHYTPYLALEKNLILKYT